MTMQKERQYEVVVNDEEQYSIWFAEKEIPIGWRKAGFCGPKESALSYIESVWVDILPRSIRTAN
ncbi:MbtH family NRPS accessory protein [Pseudomonas sp. MYb193]|uniref:MbtH family protein n=1 Tax=Pseudomonas sp. MYb193 TaxID=1827300 RepID=UPI000CF6A6DE|nr:MbtH family NRPS accessory protein [Pseudomonas sp. MYb193]AVJ24100.1 MbtH family protein [Pseudomonas sp. MYb193]